MEREGGAENDIVKKKDSVELTGDDEEVPVDKNVNEMDKNDDKSLFGNKDSLGWTGDDKNEDQVEPRKEEDERADDFIDEEKLKLEQAELSEEELQAKFEEAKCFKNEGNEAYKNEDYSGSILLYTKGLLVCPLGEKDFRAVLFQNRSAAKVTLGFKDLAIEDCTKSLENDPNYLKPLIRRAKLYEENDKLEQALADYQKILQLDPKDWNARESVQRLPPLIHERNEKLKAEMLGKLKDVGNLLLRPFGLSTDNFQVQQGEGGGYSINFKQ